MKPKHYEGQVDPIALMESQFTAEQLYGFFAGNVIKYVSRAHRKNGAEDLDKAADYLERLRVLERDRQIKAEAAARRMVSGGSPE